MGKINFVRAILGGLVAGAVIDIFQAATNSLVVERQWIEVVTRLGGSGALSIKQIVAFNVWGLVVGIVMIWLYATLLRPRMGAGPKTALFAGFLIWAFAFALGDAPPVFLHLIPLDLTVITLAVGLVETMVAGVAGAYFYKEDAAPKLKSYAAAT
jgi:hypothetical protein